MHTEAAPITPCVLLLALVAACDETGSTRATAIVRDSAGITIVDNPLPDDAPAFVVSGPILEIGAVAGAQEYELHDVRAVVRLSDGSVAVVNAGTEIRWYNADGSFRMRAGRQGSGPGEFRGIRYMRALAGDSLLVFDSSQRRVTVLAADGVPVRDEVPRLDDEQPATVAAALRDGTLLTRTVVGTPAAATPLYRAQHTFAVIRDDTVQLLRSYPGAESALHVEGSGGGEQSIFISMLPFGRAGHATAGPELFFIGSSDAFQIDVWNATARLVRIIRVDRPETPVTEGLRQTYIDAELQRRRERAAERGSVFEEAEARRQLQAQRHAPAVPAYASLLATADGGLWVRDFAMPGADAAPQRWTIFDADGRVVGIIDMPAHFTPMYVEHDVVAGVFRDSLDVPHVHACTVGPAKR